MKKQEFVAVFQLSKMRVLNVEYYTLGTNGHPYFATSAGEFIRSKRDWSRCGQCQEYITKGFSTARQFYEKWDPFHLKDLTEEQYTEMRSDLEALMKKYNYIMKELNESNKPYHPRISYYDTVELSKMTPGTHYAEVRKG